MYILHGPGHGQNMPHKCRRNALPAMIRSHIDRQLHGGFICLLGPIRGKGCVADSLVIHLRHIERMVVHIVSVKPALPVLQCLREQIQRGYPVYYFIIINVQKLFQILYSCFPNVHMLSSFFILIRKYNSLLSGFQDKFS